MTHDTFEKSTRLTEANIVTLVEPIVIDPPLIITSGHGSMNSQNSLRPLAAAAPKQSLGAVAEDMSALSDGNLSSAPKRQTVKTACNACQRRKVKCSGERPICALCQTRNQICTYDAEAGLTRIGALRQRNKELADQNTNYKIILNALRTAPDNEAVEHLCNLRAASDIEGYAEILKQSDSMFKRPRSGASSSLSMDSFHDGDAKSAIPLSDHGAESQMQATNQVMQSRQLPLDAAFTHPMGMNLAEVWPFANGQSDAVVSTIPKRGLHPLSQFHDQQNPELSAHTMGVEQITAQHQMLNHNPAGSSLPLDGSAHLDDGDMHVWDNQWTQWPDQES